MALASNLSYREFTITSLALATYPYNFKLLQGGDLHVYYKASATAITVSEMTLTTHFKVTDAGQDTGGNVILTAAGTALLNVGAILRLQREVNLTQPTDYVENDTFPSQVHEGALDRAVMMVQQLSRQQAKFLWIDDEFSTTSITKVQRQPGAVLQWDASAVGINAVYVYTAMLNPFWNSLVSATSTSAGVRTALDLGGISTAVTVSGDWNFTATVNTFAMVSATKVKATTGSFSLSKGTTASFGTSKGTTASFGTSKATTASFGTAKGTTASFGTVKATTASATTSKGTTSNFTTTKGTTGSFTTCKGTTASFDTYNGILEARGLLAGMLPVYSAPATFQITPGLIEINGIVYYNTSTKSIGHYSGAGNFYVYVNAPAGGGTTLATSDINPAPNVPVYDPSRNMWYWTGDSNYRCICGLYNSAAATMKAFVSDGNKITFTTVLDLITYNGVSNSTFSNANICTPSYAVAMMPLRGAKANVHTYFWHSAGAHWAASPHKVAVAIGGTGRTYSTSAQVEQGAVYRFGAPWDEVGQEGSAEGEPTLDSNGKFKVAGWSNRSAGYAVNLSVYQSSCSYPPGMQRM